MMKTNTLIPLMVIVFFIAIGSTCNHTPTPAELDDILGAQLKAIESVNTINVNNGGYFQVMNTNEEIAPMLMGSVISKKANTIDQIACGNLLSDVTAIDAEIKFAQPDVVAYINRSAQVNIKALDLASVNMAGEDKLKIIYEKVYAARPDQAVADWLNLDPWYDFVAKNQVNPLDTYCVVNSVVIKRLTYSVYRSISAGFATSPTPMLAIDGKVFQETGLDQSKYEIFVNLVKLPFPSPQPEPLREIIAPVNMEVQMVTAPEVQKQQIIENQAIKKDLFVKKIKAGKQVFSPKEMEMLQRINR